MHFGNLRLPIGEFARIAVWEDSVPHSISSIWLACVYPATEACDCTQSMHIQGMHWLGVSRRKQGIKYILLFYYCSMHSSPLTLHHHPLGHHDLLVRFLHYRGTTMPTLKSIQMQSVVQISLKSIRRFLALGLQIKLLKYVTVNLRCGTRAICG